MPWVAVMNAMRLSDEQADAFKCPFDGCQRRFSELWRCKVHHRGPADGSPNSGHSVELMHCPRCNVELSTVKHVCMPEQSTSKPSQAKRQRHEVSRQEAKCPVEQPAPQRRQVAPADEAKMHEAEQGPAAAPPWCVECAMSCMHACMPLTPPKLDAHFGPPP